MDYGGTSVADGLALMGTWAIQAAQATKGQIAAAGLTATVGITPMIGQNDINTEVFGIADAQKVIAFAKANPWVTYLSFWSIARDNSKQSPELGKSTNIVQSDWQFAKTFLALEN